MADTVKAWMGKVLFVNLSNGEIKEEILEEQTYIKYLGGYGLGAYITYTRQKPGVDPLGPDNLLGFVSGPLTGTPAITGNRFCVVGKSPKTGGWGDANCGGNFGPRLKQSGFDAVFFEGISDRPVYLEINDGEARIKDASRFWGLDTHVLEDELEKECGKKASVVSIGSAGEHCSLLACIINDRGRAAARSGLGAVMGSKKLKAVVVLGNKEVRLADKGAMNELRSQLISQMQEEQYYQVLHHYGTSGMTEFSVQTADCPIKNWTGTPEDFLGANRISDESVKALEKKKYACWRCPIACGGRVKVESGPYAGEGHKPEYETLGAFGAMTLVDNVEAICKANDICNRAGLDTISTGATIAFAMECYEKGILSKEDTGGIELTWGNHDALVRTTEAIARGEGIGELLGDGVRAAADELGPEAQAYAIHVHGEELPMHDPRLNPGLATSYRLDATPARHTQYSAWAVEMGMDFKDLSDLWKPWTAEKKYEYTGKARCHRTVSAFNHAFNALGVCMFGASLIPPGAQPQFLSLATGMEFLMEDLLDAGDRIANLRIAFNLREGLHNAKFNVPDRMLGIPALSEGPAKGVTVDLEIQQKEYFEEMGWDAEGVPREETIKKLGLDFVLADFYPT